MDKKQMRAQALARRDSLTEEERKTAGEKITERLTALVCYQNAEALLTYVSFRSEVDTYPLIRRALTEGKAVFAPRVSGQEMEFFRIETEEDLGRGYQGIMEPVGAYSFTDWLGQHGVTQILICMPGAAFDRKCHRIGYGGGFYDRYLAEMLGRQAVQMRTEKTDLPVVQIHTAALAFSCQIYDEISWEEHDICPECIITESGIL